MTRNEFRAALVTAIEAFNDDRDSECVDVVVGNKIIGYYDGQFNARRKGAYQRYVIAYLLAELCGKWKGHLSSTQTRRNVVKRLHELNAVKRFAA